MLKNNIKALRQRNGLSQEELSIKLNVVRQTISKWEQGLSVPDSEMLISLSRVFNVPVDTLLGETISEKQTDNLKDISEKLAVINLQLAKKKETKRKLWHYFFIFLSIMLVLTFIILVTLGNNYLEWNYNDPELAIIGIGIHSFIWIFIRIMPIIFQKNK